MRVRANDKLKTRGADERVYIKRNRACEENAGAADMSYVSSYALRYLCLFANARCLSKGRMTLYLSPDQPLKVHIPVLETSSLEFWLAPKIDDSESL